MNSRKKLFSALALLALAFLTAPLRAEADAKLAGKVRDVMKEMIGAAAKLGEAKLDGSALIFGTTKMNGNYALVDGLRERHKCTATFFAKKGDGFVRVATNVVKDDGSRAVGTVLDPAGKAIAAIKKNEAYYGGADILGKKYETGYEPIKNQAGEIIGVYYIGFLLE